MIEGTELIEELVQAVRSRGFTVHLASVRKEAFQAASYDAVVAIEVPSRAAALVLAAAMVMIRGGVCCRAATYLPVAKRPAAITAPMAITTTLWRAPSRERVREWDRDGRFMGRLPKRSTGDIRAY